MNGSSSSKYPVHMPHLPIDSLWPWVEKPLIITLDEEAGERVSGVKDNWVDSIEIQDFCLAQPPSDSNHSEDVVLLWGRERRLLSLATSLPAFRAFSSSGELTACACCRSSVSAAGEVGMEATPSEVWFVAEIRSCSVWDCAPGQGELLAS
jgi:hypothetical protein